MTEHSEYNVGNTNGYTCGYCGAFVPNGTYHVHNYTVPDQPEPWYKAHQFFHNTSYGSLLERIAVALEKIAERLLK